jgi:Acetyltransferase (GNAT) domain
VKARLLSPEDPDWATCLTGLSYDIYHLPGYVALESRRMGGEAKALLVEDDSGLLFLPLVFQPLPADLGLPAGRDAVTPYGYPTLLYRSDGRDAEFLEDALETARQHLGEQDIACLFMRGHPLLSFPEASLAAHGTVVRHGETVWMDLRLSEEARRQQLRPRYRSYLNRLNESGIKVSPDPEFDHYDRFIDLYHKTMADVAAASWYYFGRNYFMDLKAALGERLILITAQDMAGEVISAGLFMECNGLVQYHLSGTDKRQGHQDALKLVIHFAGEWFAQRGNHSLHLGGGLGGTADALFQFKTGFSRQRAMFRTWRTVCNQELFSKACAAWEEKSKETIIGMEGYFPPYRQAF